MDSPRFADTESINLTQWILRKNVFLIKARVFREKFVLFLQVKCQKSIILVPLSTVTKLH